MSKYTIPGEDQVDYLRDRMKDYKRSQRAKLEREAERKSKQCATVEVYADMLKVKAPHTSRPQVGGGPRKECKGFSISSRRRLLQALAQWNLADLHCSFVTLTYPALYAADWRIWKRDVEAMFKRLQRAFPDLVGCAWRVEFQRRGAPHFHLILASSLPSCSCGSSREVVVSGHKTRMHKPGCRIAVVRALVADMWPDIVREGYKLSGGDLEAYREHYERNKRAGTGVESVQGRRQLTAYVSKYLAKTDQAEGNATPEKWGRSWGFRDINGELDFSPVEEIDMTFGESIVLRRLVRRWLRSRGKSRYADRLAFMANYSVLGLGADSENKRTAYRMLGGVRKGLFAAHIPPQAQSMRFIDRVGSGLVTVSRPSVVAGARVITPLGPGLVNRVLECQVLKRLRCTVTLDTTRPDGTRWAAFDLWEVRSQPATTVNQAALW